MRDILFKGFQVDSLGDSEAVVDGYKFKGYWVEWNEYGLIQRPNRLFSERVWDMRIKPETVGQFTGLLDKHSKRIFEFARILFNWSDYGLVPMKVIYDEGSFFLDPDGQTEICGQKIHRIHLYSHDKTENGYRVDKQCEVVGTVFDDESRIS